MMDARKRLEWFLREKYGLGYLYEDWLEELLWLFNPLLRVESVNLERSVDEREDDVVGVMRQLMDVRDLAWYLRGVLDAGVD